MKRIVKLAAPGLIGLLALCSAPANAWFTKGNAKNNWRSIYVPTGSYHDHTGGTENEHAEITDHHLYTISSELGDLFGSRAFVHCDDSRRCAAVPSVVDLNASHLRRAVEMAPNLHLLDTHGDYTTELEERTMPPVAMFAGLPDFNYTVYDWINKGTRCPSLPLGADSYSACHEYATGWLGAGFNTTHWGDLAVKVYARHHQIALGRAAKAKAMDELFRNHPGGLPDGSQWHARYTGEMELLALYYESTGQHFLQDRWATGHMLSRWGSPDYEHLPQKDLYSATTAAALTGSVHGSREIFGFADPLNLPLINFKSNTIAPARWRYADATKRYDGIGDFGYPDMRDGKFGKDYGAKDVDLHVEKQDAQMTMCGTEGFRHVIAGFADNQGKFGSFGVTLPEPPAGSSAGSTRLGSDPTTNKECTDAWVTNRSYREGLRTLAGSSKLLGDGVVHELVYGLNEFFFGEDTPDLGIVRFGQVYLTARAAAIENEDKEKHGVQSAKTGIEIRSWGLRPNHNYALPSYFEPADLETLPERSETVKNASTAPSGGMDLDALHGFFNRGHTQAWCDGIYDELDELREKIKEGGPRTEEYRAVCSYLAKRVYKSVDPNYPKGGPRDEKIGVYSPFDFENQPAKEKYGEEFEPVCAYFDALGQPPVQTNNANDDKKPYYIKPGYVEKPGDPGKLKYTAKTLENWCDQIPVVDLENDEDHPSSVGGFGHLDGDRTIELRGANFGIRTGTGAVGTVEVQTIDEDWVSAEIWDGMIGEWGDGWSLSDVDVFFRVPGASGGYPSLADDTMSPAQIQAVEPAAYSMRLTRPSDADAPPVFRADGEQTVGDYEVLIEPHWLEAPSALPSNGIGHVHNFPAPTLWFWENMELLDVGFYTKSRDAYAEVPFTLELFFDEQVLFENDQEVHTSMPGNLAAVIRSAPGDTFGPGFSDVVFFIAFH